MVAGIGGACIRDAYIDSICAVGTWIRFADACISVICVKNTFVRNVKPGNRQRVLLISGVILAGLGVNDCCLILFINLILISMNCESCYSISS